MADGVPLALAPPESTQTFAEGALAAKFGEPALPTIVLPPDGEHKATVVFLHGLGDTGNGVREHIVESFELPFVKWVIPSASRKPVSINKGLVMPAWFDVFKFEPEAQEDEEGIDLAARYIAALLEQEAASAPAGTRIILGGISMGGAVALHLTARKFAGSFLDGSDASRVPLDGTFTFCTWLPLYRSKPSLAQQVKTLGQRSATGTLRGARLQSAARSHPFLMCHGEADPLIFCVHGQLYSQELRRLGFSKLQFLSYPNLAHWAFHPQIKDVRQFLASLAGVELPPASWELGSAVPRLDLEELNALSDG